MVSVEPSTWAEIGAFSTNNPPPFALRRQGRQFESAWGHLNRREWSSGSEARAHEWKQQDHADDNRCDSAELTDHHEVEQAKTADKRVDPH